ncbi:hypothetical protein QQF64_009633 [Cirrhinus molitorella]|uniref:Integrase catalytic domain-containing protein n=1 Tax=Cirrhinus molitorella TaxID=172907 RepID=A0ABR3M1P4_9TELE
MFLVSRESGERVPPFPRRVVQERCAPEGTVRRVHRPASPIPRDEPIPTEMPEAAPKTWLAGCGMHQAPPRGAPQAKVKVNGKPYIVFLDSGSAVSLVRPNILSSHDEAKTYLPITCVHGDTHDVPAQRVVISASPGAWTLEVGLVKDLPVPVLVGRDWPGFDRLLTATTQPANARGGRRRRRPQRTTPERAALAASDSGRDGESPPSQSNLFFDVFQQVTGGGFFGRAQCEDDRLKHCWSQVRKIDDQDAWPGPHSLPYFVVKKGLLYCVAQWRGEEKELLVVPRSKTEAVLELAHAHPMAGVSCKTPSSGSGTASTGQGLTRMFNSPRTPPPSPLIPLPIIDVPFECIGMDLVGPLPKSAHGHKHILVIVDYATRYPEAAPLRKATAKAIAQELFLLASRVGIPKEILTDQGTPFMSQLMADLCRLLGVKQLRTTVYHPQTDGLVERFNQTLKQMLRRVAAEDRRDWDLMLPYVLFGIREVPQASTGFTPFELLFGRQPRGLLDVAKEGWDQQPAPHRTVVEHVKQMRDRLDRVMPLVREHLTKAQQAQQRQYNRAAQSREFQPRDRVMVLVPTAACKFLATWQGPYTILEKKWVGTRDQLATLAISDPVVVDTNPELAAGQKTQLQHLVGQFSDVFSTRPGQTNVIEHEIRTPPGVVVRQCPYWVPEAHRTAIEKVRTNNIHLYGSPAFHSCRGSRGVSQHPPCLSHQSKLSRFMG